MSFSGFNFKSDFLLVIVAAALVSACTTQNTASIATVEVVKRPPSKPNTEYTGRTKIVKRGDNLYSVSFEAGLNHVEVARWNGIEGPDYTIHPNQVITLSDPDPQSAIEVVELQESQSNLPIVDESVDVASQPSDQAAAKPVPEIISTAAVSSSGWIWPTEGTVIRNFSTANNVNGIQIAGEQGTPVIAAASGEVVYSGTGLPGYGRLIIIKHDQRYLSAYAHNSRVVVNEGDAVQQGQKIAEMGDTDTDRVKLHFEIRVDGNPVNPRKFLPRG